MSGLAFQAKEEKIGKGRTTTFVLGVKTGYLPVF